MTRFGRVVVTGGAGFLGSHLCEALVGGGAEVVCVDDLSTGSRAGVGHLLDHPRFSLVVADVSAGLPVSGPVDLVLHFASAASPPQYLARPVATLKVGSQGTFNALALARDAGARFVMASTSEVYGDPLQHPQREEYWGNVNPVGPRSVYDEAKRFSEALVTAFHRAEGVDTGIVRIFNTYGPRLLPRDGRAVSTFIRQALAGEPLTITGDGTQTRSLCYVSDTVSGVLALAGSDVHEPVNVGNPHEITIRALAETIREITGSSSPLHLVDAPADDPRRRCPDTSRAAALLDWKPRVDLGEGLRRTVEWHRSSPLAHAS